MTLRSSTGGTRRRARAGKSKCMSFHHLRVTHRLTNSLTMASPSTVRKSTGKGDSFEKSDHVQLPGRQLLGFFARIENGDARINLNRSLVAHHDSQQLHSCPTLGTDQVYLGDLLYPLPMTDPWDERYIYLHLLLKKQPFM